MTEVNVKIMLETFTRIRLIDKSPQGWIRLGRRFKDTMCANINFVKSKEKVVVVVVGLYKILVFMCYVDQ